MDDFDYRFPTQIWLDDVRQAPQNWLWTKSVNETKSYIYNFIISKENILDEFDYPDNDLWNLKLKLDLDHDLGAFAADGGDAIRLLDWLELTRYGDECLFRIHTMNPVGRKNMMRIIQKNKWGMI